MLMVANFANTKRCKKAERNTETLAHGYSVESTQREISNNYEHDRFKMVIRNLCIPVIWTKVASALEGLSLLLCFPCCAGDQVSGCQL